MVAVAITLGKNSDFISCLPQRCSCSACSGPEELRGLISIILHAKAADPAHGVLTLLKCCEPAILATKVGTVNQAPGVVLGLSSISETDDADANSKHEQQGPHGDLLAATLLYK